MKKPVALIENQQEVKDQTGSGLPDQEELNRINNYVSKDLPTYVSFEAPFSPAGLQALNEIPIVQEDIIQGTIMKGTLNQNTRNSDIFFLDDLEQYGWVYKMVKEVIIRANKVYDFNLWNIEPIQYSLYKEGQFYKTHTDLSAQTKGGMRKLSFSIQLTDPEEYEGGNLVFHIGKAYDHALRKKGSMTIFPSFTPHEVTAVTKGERRALVGWVLGPNFA
jgi:PKHD-type hydroxylase